MTRTQWKLARWGRLLPVVFLYQAFGCLPDDGYRLVLAENMLQTAAIIIQSTTALFFGNIFGFI